MSENKEQPKNEKIHKEDRPSVLVIDDDYDFFEMLNAILKNKFDFDYAPDGFTAFKVLAKNRYDCIVSDINMPFINGLTLLKELKHKRIVTPVILISGNISDEVNIEALRPGAYNIVEKPFDETELEAKVLAAIKLAQTNDIETCDEHEKAYIYNALKTYYYDVDRILAKIAKYGVPMSFISQELVKKEETGKCLLDDLNNLKYYHHSAS